MRTRHSKAPWRQSKARGTSYENRYREILRKRGYLTLRTAGSMSDGTGIDVVAWDGPSLIFASCKDDGRGCKSAVNLLQRIRQIVPEVAMPLVVHSRSGEEFCEH